MKRSICLILAISAVMLSACGGKVTSLKEREPVESTTTVNVEKEPTDKAASTVENTTAEVTKEHTQPITSSSVTTSLTEIHTTTTKTSSDTEQPFETDENGAVIFEVEEDTAEEELIAAAQALYEQACQTEYKFHVGCPYNLDYQNYVENKYGWQYYLVTDEGYSTIADVENDYYKVFAKEYGNDLSELYIEQDGKLYALDGARGMNIFYKSSKVTAITEKSESEIIFEVENYYSGNDISPDTPVTKKETFSVVINNGEWRAGDFYLPY